jgi:cytosine/adenosine deaminase-related metal-dependent hydrolase
VFDAVADAARTIGIRVHVARGSMDLGESKGGLPPDFLVEELDAILASTESVAGRLHDGERVVVTVAPCSPFSVTPELMRESAALARRLGLRLHTHLAETLDEERDAVARFGRRPVDLVEELGWVAGDVWLAHGIHFNDDEVRRLGAAGTGVAHCPSSNARLGSGLCRVTDLVGAGSPVGLGVDGVASNEVGGLFPELRQALYTGRRRPRRRARTPWPGRCSDRTGGQARPGRRPAGGPRRGPARRRRRPALPGAGPQGTAGVAPMTPYAPARHSPGGAPAPAHAAGWPGSVRWGRTQMPSPPSTG